MPDAFRTVLGTNVGAPVVVIVAVVAIGHKSSGTAVPAAGSCYISVTKMAMSNADANWGC